MVLKSHVLTLLVYFSTLHGLAISCDTQTIYTQLGTCKTFYYNFTMFMMVHVDCMYNR